MSCRCDKFRVGKVVKLCCATYTIFSLLNPVNSALLFSAASVHVPLSEFLGRSKLQLKFEPFKFLIVKRFAKPL